jgi:CRP-like cAMP-binding protein
MAAQSFPAGHIIFEKGDLSVCAYQIESGQVEMLRGNSAEPVRVALLQKGEIFGEMGLVEERPRSMTARAVTAVSLSTMTRGEFEHRLTQEPQQCMKYLRMLFERLRTMTDSAQGLDEEEKEDQQKYKVTIFAESTQLANVIPAGGLPIRTFPFRIGRAPEEKEKTSLNVNNLDLHDSVPYKMSREHLSIEIHGGKVVVFDRGSYLGTTVNGVKIGGHHKEGRVELRLGDNNLVLGGKGSRFRFRLVVALEEE